MPDASRHVHRTPFRYPVDGYPATARPVVTAAAAPVVPRFEDNDRMVEVILLPDGYLAAINGRDGATLHTDAGQYSLLNLAALNTPQHPVRIGPVLLRFVREYRTALDNARRVNGLATPAAGRLYVLITAGLLTGDEVRTALGIGPAVNVGDLTPSLEQSLLQMGLSPSAVMEVLAEAPSYLRWPAPLRAAAANGMAASVVAAIRARSAGTVRTVVTTPSPATVTPAPLPSRPLRRRRPDPPPQVT